MIMGSFVICWLPMMVTFFVFAIVSENMDQTRGRYIFNFCILLSHCNAAINPLIYGYRIKDVRMTISNILHCGRNQDVDNRATFTEVNANDSIDNELRVA